MKRRVLLQFLGSVLATLPLPLRLRAQTSSALRPVDEARLRAVAEAVLPGEIGAEGRDAVVRAFLTWVRDYRAGADTDHGYGFPRIRRTGTSPALQYGAQLDGLDDRSRARGQSFADLPLDQRRAVLETAIAGARIERLPSRPDGGHVATDLMGFYFNGTEANDLCYGSRIGRDTCRTLAGSEERPAARGGR
jgi:hypothetical protein